MGGWYRPLWVAGLSAFGVSLLSLYIPPWISLAVAGGLLLLALCVHRMLRFFFVTLCMAVMLASGGGHRLLEELPVCRAVGREDTVTGYVLEVQGRRSTLQVMQSDHLPDDCRLDLYVSDLAAPKVGECIRATVRLESLTETRAYRRAEGVFLSAYPTEFGEDSLTVLEDGRREGLFARWRRQLVEEIRRRLPGQEGALLTAICFGELGDLDESVSEAFRASGLTHLLVVSGLHLTLLSGCVLVLLRACHLPRMIAVVGTMVATVAFMLLVGLSASVVRAGVMCLVMLAGLLFRRPADPLNSMGLALVLLLTYSPYMAMSAGLQLSFTATFGVLVIAPRIYGWLTDSCPTREGLLGVLVGFWKGIAAGVAACVGALLPVTPLLTVWFEATSLTALPANLLTVLPAGWCLMVGWIAVLLMVIPLAPFVWLGEGALFVAAMPARWLLVITEWLGQRDCQLLLPAGWRWAVVMVLCTAAVLWIFRPVYVRRRSFVLFLCMALLATALCAAGEHHTTTLWMRTGEEGSVLLWQEGEHRVLLATHSQALAQDEWLPEDTGTGHLDALVVGAGEPCHAGSLAGIMKDYIPAYIYMLEDGYWVAGLCPSPLPVTVGDVVPLWESAMLTVCSETHWRVDTPGGTMDIYQERGQTTLKGTGLLLTAVPGTQQRLVCGIGSWKEW